MDKTVFISQTRASFPASYHFAESLKAKAKVFMSADSESISGGDPWLSSVMKGLEQCTDFFMLISSAQEDKNRWLLFEIGYAKGRNLTPKVFLHGISQEQLGNLRLVTPQFFNRLTIDEVSFESTTSSSAVDGNDDIFVMYDPKGRAKAEKFTTLCASSNKSTILVELSQPDSQSQTLEANLGSKSSLLILITTIQDLQNQWLPYWVGFAKGRGVAPKILVSSGAWIKDRFPDLVREIQMIDTGDTSRWSVELGYALGMTIEPEPFADFFRSKPVLNWP